MMLPRRDPYFWIHLAGLATVPLWLDICLAGLAVGDPVVPPWLELTTLGSVGTVPILWMQWQRPFYIFSLLLLALRPDALSEDRQRLLSLHRSWLSRGLVVISAIALLLVLIWLYRLAPVAAPMTPLAGQPRAVGWLVCAIAFLLANLFVQVPAMVVSLLLVPTGRVQQVPPYDAERILQDFTVIGLRVRQILPAGVEPVRAAPESVVPSQAESLPEDEASPAEVAPGREPEPAPEFFDDAEAEPFTPKATAHEETPLPSTTSHPLEPSSPQLSLSQSEKDTGEEAHAAQDQEAEVADPGAVETVASLDDIVVETETLEAAGWHEEALAQGASMASKTALQSDT
jgi:hypothetical protein